MIRVGLALPNRYLISILFCAAVFLSLCPRTGAHPPTGIVLDDHGTLYFTDLETVWKLDPQGRLSRFRPGVSGRHVHELSIDELNNLYGADISYESQRWITSVWKMTPAGELSYLVAPTTNPPRGVSIWRDREGMMYFVEQDNRRKSQTLFLRRNPDGVISILAGGPYGQQDGKGTLARLSSIGGMVIGKDRTIYFTDGTSLRKITMDGTVTTLAKDLNRRTAEDPPPLFGKNDGILTGLNIDSDENIYLADAGNQRLLKINSQGRVEVVFRGQPPYYPNGVVAAPNGVLYLLEVGFQPPRTWLPARVRKITPAGENLVIAVSGDQEQAKAVAAGAANAMGPSGFFKERVSYLASGCVVLFVGFSFVAWKRFWKSRSA